MALFNAVPTLIGTPIRSYTPDLITFFFLTYYNWIIFFIGVFLILYATRMRFFPKKQDPLDFEEMKPSLWDRFVEWVRHE